MKDKKIFKKWWFWVIIVVIVLGVIGSATGGGKNDISDNQETAKSQDTPDSALTDLSIGSPVTISGVTVTVNSIKNGVPAISLPTYEVNVTYKNNSGRGISISPYDWSTVLHSGSDKAHVGGDTSFSLENLSNDEEWTGNVTLWADAESEKVKFESSYINLAGDDKKATWLIK